MSKQSPPGNGNAYVSAFDFFSVGNYYGPDGKLTVARTRTQDLAKFGLQRRFAA